MRRFATQFAVICLELANRHCVCRATCACAGYGPFGAGFFRRRRPFTRPRSSSGHVSASGVGQALAFRASQHHLAMASGVSFAVSRAEQPEPGSPGCQLACAYAVHRAATHRHHRTALRRARNRWARNWRSAGPCGVHESRRGAKSHAQQSAVHRAAYDPSDHSARAREKSCGHKLHFLLFRELPERRLEVASANSVWPISSTSTRMGVTPISSS